MFSSFGRGWSKGPKRKKKRPSNVKSPPPQPRYVEPPKDVTSSDVSSEQPSYSERTLDDPSYPKLLSILIPTLSNRSAILTTLFNKLEVQIRALGSQQNSVEVVINEDSGEASVGDKRNALLESSKGRFVVFVDDDDDVSNDYVLQIFDVIKKRPNIDCVGFRAVMTTRGKGAKQVVYSIKHKIPRDTPFAFLRPPQHITPIRRAVAIRHKFPSLNLGEDVRWASKIYPDLKEEGFVDKVLYHYKFDPRNSATQGGAVVRTASTSDFSVVIPSARHKNLIPCVRSILEKEPAMSPEKIIVVNDGAREHMEPSVPGLTWVEGVKPFCFARNVNLGIRRASGDVIIMNDDTVLETQFGMTSMSYAVTGAPNIGVCSAAISGFVGNSNQKPVALTGLRPEHRVVAFICVYIPKLVLDMVGLLDERFEGYGFDDNDYCRRVLNAKRRIVVYDGCIVRHGEGKKTSTFRSRSDISNLFSHNKRLYEQKWGG